MKKLGLGFYDTYVGPYDEFNPRYVKNKAGVMEILYLIASENPYSLSIQNIRQRLDIEERVCSEALEALTKIKAIEMKEEKYKINFPAFIEEDLELLGKFNLDAGKAIGDKIMAMGKDIDERISKLSCYGKHDISRIRYHIIGNFTMDGGAMDFLTEKGLITTSKRQPGDRDYLIIGYEDNDVVKNFSDNIICSCNNHRGEELIFFSFGDAMGNRKDMFRFFKQVQNCLAKASEHEELNLIYARKNEENNKRMANECEKLLLIVFEEEIGYSKLSEEDKSVADFFNRAWIS